MDKYKNSKNQEIINDLHLLTKDSTYLLFNINDLSLYKINDYTFQMIKDLLNNKYTSSNKYDNKVKSLINSHLQKKSEIKTQKSCKNSQHLKSKVLDRLVLNISNTCNLNCIYCYAVGGNYGDEDEMMSDRTAISAVNYFYAIFDEINSIQFFGGEPLLNYQLIDTVCSYITNLVKIDELKSKPVFSIVTNGTILDINIIHIIKKYNIKLTISIDGPEPIHDYLRGEGTHHIIMENIKLMKKYDINFNVEATFTNYHIKMGYDYPVLMKYFSEELNLTNVHIPLVAAEKDSALYIKTDDYIEYYKECITYSIKGLSEEKYILDSITTRLLRAMLLKKKINLYCPAGAITLSVSFSGEIYPCFMFTNKRDFSLGNVWGHNDFKKINKVNEIIKEAGKDKAVCHECWVRNLCFGCMGNDLINTGSLGINEFYCQFVQEIVSHFLFLFSDLLGHNISQKQIKELKKSKQRN